MTFNKTFWIPRFRVLVQVSRYDGQQSLQTAKTLPLVTAQKARNWRHEIVKLSPPRLIITQLASPQRSLRGKQIIIRGDKRKADLLPIVAQLERCDTHATLATIGYINYTKMSGRNAWYSVGLVPTYTLPDLAYLACFCYNDSANHVPTIANIKNMADVIHNIQKIDDTRPDGAIEYLQRLSTQQFDEQRETKHDIARTLLLYTEAWNGAEKSKGDIADILSSIEKCIGLPLLRYIRAGCYLSKFPRASLLNIFSKTTSQGPKIVQFESDLSVFIARNSTTYRQLGNAITVNLATGLYTITDPLLLKRYPFVACEAVSSTNNQQNIALPIPRFALAKSTRGVYYDMTAYFQGRGKSNSFRTAFGHAFQEYVYLVTKNTLNNAVTLSEQEQKKLGFYPIADLVVIEGTKATVFETKQSNLFYRSRESGYADDIKKDLEKNIGKGFAQLNTFHEAVDDASAMAAQYRNIRHWEYLIVSYEHLTWGNSFNKENIIKSASHRHHKIDAQIHVTDIEDFEYFLAHADQHGLADELHRKRSSIDTYEQDFRDYLAVVNPTSPPNMYLDLITDNFLCSFLEDLNEN